MRPTADVRLQLTVNGERVSLQVDPRTSLLDLLHEHLHLIGTKKGCEIVLIGVAPAIANAVFNATGKRMRGLPILPEARL